MYACVSKKIANEDYITCYLKEISQYPTLTPEQETKLFQQMYNGDLEAKEILIKCNLRLVVYVVSHLYNQIMDFSDLIQEGNLALIKAVEYFDLERGNKFSTYAIKVIKRLLIRETKNKSHNIRIPIWMQDQITEYRNIYEELRSKLYRNPTIDEIAEKMGVTSKRVITYQKLAEDSVSLNTVINNPNGYNGDYELIDLVKYENQTSIEDLVIEKNLKEDLAKLFQEASLKEYELDHLNRRFGLDGQIPITLTEMAKEENSHRQNLYNREQRILKKLRKYIKEY